MIQVFLRTEIPTFCPCQSASVRWVGLRVCWNLGLEEGAAFSQVGNLWKASSHPSCMDVPGEVSPGRSAPAALAVPGN